MWCRTRNLFAGLSFFALWGACQPLRAPSDAGIANADAGPHDAASAAEHRSIRIPLGVSSYADGGGKLLRVSVSLQDAAPFDVLVDTGSDGLRVFGHLLPAEMRPAEWDEVLRSVTVQFGAGAEMSGPLVRTQVRLGAELATDAPIAVHWVQEMRCADAMPDCELASGSAPFFTDIGIYGILGVSTRRGQWSELFSPFAQLPEPYANGYVMHAGVADGDGYIQFGDTNSFWQAGASPAIVALPMDAPHSNGTSAWRDDAIRGCFFLNDAPLDPNCTDMVIDSGSSADVVYANTPDPAWSADGALLPGVRFRAEVGSAWAYAFTVGTWPTPSEDLVFVDGVEPFAVLGVRVFLENDVGFELQSGELRLRPTPTRQAGLD